MICLLLPSGVRAQSARIGLATCLGKNAGEAIAVGRNLGGPSAGPHIQARLAIVDRGDVVGTFYVDELGQRYIEALPGRTMRGFPHLRSDGKVHPLPFDRLFGGEV